MKTVLFTKLQYDEIAYPAVALHSPGSTVALLRICDAVMSKLEVVGTRGKVLDRALWGPGVEKAPPPLYKLKDIATEIEFEDTEAEFLFDKIVELLPSTQGRLMRDALPLLDALENKKE